MEVATNGPNGAVPILESVLEDRGMLNRFYGTPTPTMAAKLPTLQTMETEMITKIIMGDSIELFDQFVEDWYDLGGTEIVDEVNHGLKTIPIICHFRTSCSPASENAYDILARESDEPERRNCSNELPLYIMLAPAVVLALVYSYLPMVGIVMAFQRVLPGQGHLWLALGGVGEFQIRF